MSVTNLKRKRIEKALRESMREVGMPHTRGMYYIFENGKVIEADMPTWAAWFETSKDRLIRQDRTWHGYLVSTIFLGMDHNFLFDGPPLLFETGVDYDSWRIFRHSTLEDALRFHRKAYRLSQIHPLLLDWFHDPARHCWLRFKRHDWHVRKRKVRTAVTTEYLQCKACDAERLHWIFME